MQNKAVICFLLEFGLRVHVWGYSGKTGAHLEFHLTGKRIVASTLEKELTWTANSCFLKTQRDVGQSLHAVLRLDGLDPGLDTSCSCPPVGLCRSGKFVDFFLWDTSVLIKRKRQTCF